MKPISVLRRRIIACGIVALSVLVIAAFFAGCGDECTTEADPVTGGPVVKLTSQTECKDVSAPESTITPDIDRIRYNYDGSGTLLITHVNTGFNCCPDSFRVGIDVGNDTIRITETELLTNGGCRCLCLYDLEYEITDLPAGSYRIEVVQMYLAEEDELLESTIDLTSAAADSFDVTREHYPWGDYVTEPAVGQVLSSGCLDNVELKGKAQLSSDTDCVQYTFDRSNTLSIVHRNAGFNCCPLAIDVDLAVIGDTLRITETEQAALCDCDCLYDLEYQIHNLPPGVYVIDLPEMYMPNGDDPLRFTADIYNIAVDTFCVTRSEYPWGM